MKKHVIWTNYDIDFEDWRTDLEEYYPDHDEDELREIMHETNDEYLDDERANLSVSAGAEILVIADLGLWNGRFMGYKEIGSGRIADCLYSSDDYMTWYVDQRGDLCGDGIHHDGRNYYTYRAWKPNTTWAQRENLRSKIYNGTATRRDITRYTRRLGDDIAKVYGWKI